MCLVIDVDYDGDIGIIVMSYKERDTRQKKLGILDKLRSYIEMRSRDDIFLRDCNFNFFCFGNFLDSDDDIDVVRFYIYAKK